MFHLIRFLGLDEKRRKRDDYKRGKRNDIGKKSANHGAALSR